MAALMRQANSGYELANKPMIKNERPMVEEKREKTKQQTISEKKEEAGNTSVSNVTKDGCTRNLCTQYNPLMT